MDYFYKKAFTFVIGGVKNMATDDKPAPAGTPDSSINIRLENPTFYFINNPEPSKSIIEKFERRMRNNEEQLNNERKRYRYLQLICGIILLAMLYFLGRFLIEKYSAEAGHQNDDSLKTLVTYMWTYMLGALAAFCIYFGAQFY